MLTFEEFMIQADTVLLAAIGVTHHDLADAPWRDYYEDHCEDPDGDMSPTEAASLCLTEYNDFPEAELQDLLDGEII